MCCRLVFVVVVFIWSIFIYIFMPYTHWLLCFVMIRLVSCLILFLSGLVYNLIMTSVSLIHVADLSFGVSLVPSVRSKCLVIVELLWVTWVVAEVPFPLDLQLRALCLWHCPDWPFQRSIHEVRSLGSKVRLRSVGYGLDDGIGTFVLFTCPSLTFSCVACHDLTH